VGLENESISTLIRVGTLFSKPSAFAFHRRLEAPRGLLPEYASPSSRDYLEFPARTIEGDWIADLVNNGFVRRITRHQGAFNCFRDTLANIPFARLRRIRTRVWLIRARGALDCNAHATQAKAQITCNDCSSHDTSRWPRQNQNKSNIAQGEKTKCGTGS